MCRTCRKVAGKPEISEARIKEHYATELYLKERMPFILGWSAGPNLSLASRPLGQTSTTGLHTLRVTCI